MSLVNVNQVDPSTGTTLTLGTSGDTVSIPSGVTLSGAGTITASAANLAASGAGGVTGTLPIANGGTGAVTLAAAGITNAPMFRVFRSTSQSVVNSTYTKIEYDSESYDTDAAFDSSTNYRFTAPSAGKYYFLSQLQYTAATDGGQLRAQFYVNGSAFHASLRMQHTSPNTSDNFMIMADVLSLSASDYVEVYGYQGEGGSRNFESYKNYFLGYKLIGA